MQRHIHETSVSHSCFSTQKTTNLLSNVLDKPNLGASFRGRMLSFVLFSMYFKVISLSW